MDKIINPLVRRNGTNCPYTIARSLNISVWFEDLGASTRGFYFRKLRRRYIAIHQDLSEEWQRFVCAHELGHDRLHPGISRFFIEEHSFFNPGKFERQANEFAVKLLTAGDQLQPNESVIELLLRNGVPEEMRRYY